MMKTIILVTTLTATLGHAEPAGTELGFHFGLVQPVVLHGFNAAIEIRHGRWIATYSHGQGIEASRLGGTLTKEEDAAHVRLMLPWTTGGGVGYRVFRDLYVLADVKVHHYEAYAGAALSEYSTLTVGGEIGWRFMPWKGLTITPVVRYWPNVWDNAPADGVVVKTPDGGALMHQPAKQGVDGVFVNLLVGWSFDVGS